MGFMNMLGKAVGGLTNMTNELQTCITIVEMENLSDEELMKCVKSASDRGCLFMGTAAQDINFTIRELAVKKVASDRGLLQND